MFLNIVQKINNILYKYFGMRDIILNIQLYINKQRHNNNDIDKQDILFYDEEKPIMQ